MKRTVITIIIILACLTLAAEGKTLTFLWDWDDFDVTRFRYQLDSQNEDGWTECDYYETAVTLENLDLSVPHVLYVQQSYDGINWSESSELTSETSANVDELIGNQATVDAFESEAEVVAQPEPEVDAVAAESAVEQAPSDVHRFDIGGRLMLKSDLSKSTAKTLETGVVFGINELWKISQLFSMDLRFSLMADFYPRSPLRFDSVNLSALSVWSMSFSDRLGIGIPLGLEMAGNFESGAFRFGIGGSAGARMRFLMGKYVEAEFTGLFHILTTEQSFSAGISFSYRF